MNQWRLLHLTSRYQAVVLAIMAAGSLWLWPNGALAVFVGGAFSGLNFVTMKSLVARLIANPANKSRLVYGSLLAVKMFMALAIMTLLIVVLRLEPVGFAIGLSSMLFGFGAAMAHLVFRPAAPTT